MRFLKYFCFFTLLLSLGSCIEDPIDPVEYGSLFGEVLDENEIPIEKVTITSNPPTTSLSTDSLGRFAYESIKTGTYSIRATKDGFVTKLETVSINADRTTNIIIRMQSDTLSNNLPMVPKNPMPLDQSVDLENALTLEWEVEDLDGTDDLLYSVELFSGNMGNSEIVLDKSANTFVDLENLSYGTTYFWQVIVYDGNEEPVFGQIWEFNTQEYPDHRYLFARRTNGKYDIYSSDELGNAIKLTNNAGSNWRPRMNPDRTKIAYISNQDIESYIYVMDRDGSNPVKISPIPIAGFNNLELDYSWSPDGSKLLFMNNGELYTVQNDGTGLELITQAASGFTFTSCDWNEQSNNIVVRITGSTIYESFIYTIDTEGNFLQQLTNDVVGHTGSASYSIVGNNVLYTQDISTYEGADGRQLDARIILHDIVLFSTVDLSNSKEAGTNDLEPRFAPNGAQVIFTNTNNDGISQKDIYIIDIDGGSRTLLFENAEMPEWK